MPINSGKPTLATARRSGPQDRSSDFWRTRQWLALGQRRRGLASKQRPDQLYGHRLIALRTPIPLQAISERVCVGDCEGARPNG
jgi:hypothetical protein